MPSLKFTETGTEPDNSVHTIKSGLPMPDPDLNDFISLRFTRPVYAPYFILTNGDQTIENVDHDARVDWNGGPRKLKEIVVADNPVGTYHPHHLFSISSLATPTAFSKRNS